MDGRRMNDLREEIGMQFSLTERIVRRWMMWAGQGVWMETTKEWSVEVVKSVEKRDVRKMEEANKWREKAAGREK